MLGILKLTRQGSSCNTKGNTGINAITLSTMVKKASGKPCVGKTGIQSGLALPESSLHVFLL
jgi:hypothetical protein